MSWERRQLSDIFWFQEGPGVRKWQFTNEGVKLLNVGNITTDGTIDLDATDRHVSNDEAHGKYSHFLADAGDLVIASSGITFDPDGYLRTKIAFLEEQHLPLCMNTSTIRFKSKTEEGDLNFLRHWLQSSEFRKQISKFVTGSAQLNFGPSHLKKMTIKLPPLAEQRRIAGILDQADAHRRQRQRALDHLNQLGQSIFYEMFEGDLTQTRQPLSGFCKVKGGKRLPKGSSYAASKTHYPYIRVSDMNNGTIDQSALKFINSETHHKVSRYTISETDLMISIAGTIGQVSEIPPALSGANLTENAAKICEIDGSVIDKSYLAFALKTRSSQFQISSKTGQVTIGKLALFRILQIEIPMPSLNLQTQFKQRLAAINSREHLLRTSLQKTSTLFASLQQRAFAGEL